MIISNLVRYLIVLLVVLGGLLAFEVVVGAYFDASALLALTGTVVAVGLPFGLLTAGAIRLAGTRVGSPWVRMATVLVATGIPLLGVALLGVIVPDGGPGAGSAYQGPYPVYAFFLGLTGFLFGLFARVTARPNESSSGAGP